jgi:hypothetical protein
MPKDESEVHNAEYRITELKSVCKHFEKYPLSYSDRKGEVNYEEAKEEWVLLKSISIFFVTFRI